MVSKIDSSTPGSLRRLDSTRSEAAGKSTAATPAQESRPSAGASLLARATELAMAAPEINQERVDSIKEAIARGDYRIDPEATARAFLEMEQS